MHAFSYCNRIWRSTCTPHANKTAMNPPTPLFFTHPQTPECTGPGSDGWVLKLRASFWSILEAKEREGAELQQLLRCHHDVPRLQSYGWLIWGWGEAITIDRWQLVVDGAIRSLVADHLPLLDALPCRQHLVCCRDDSRWGQIWCCVCPHITRLENEGQGQC